MVSIGEQCLNLNLNLNLNLSLNLQRLPGVFSANWRRTVPKL
jgi:hypothetical protein